MVLELRDISRIPASVAGLDVEISAMRWGALGVRSCVLAGLDSFDCAADGGVVGSVVLCDFSLFVASGIVSRKHGSIPILKPVPGAW